MVCRTRSAARLVVGIPYGGVETFAAASGIERELGIILK